MGLRDIEGTLPPGFRFYPRDEELVCHYLYKRVANEMHPLDTLVEVDLHTCEPWQLPDAAMLGANEWYFFSFRDRKYATGVRANRATKSGYWKATGKDRPVIDPATQAVVGMRKTLVFYLERAPNGKKTGWVMHEFRIETPHTPPKEDWVLCRVFHKRKKELASTSDDHQFSLEVDEVHERINGCFSSSGNMGSSPPDHKSSIYQSCMAPSSYNKQQIVSFSNNPPPLQLQEANSQPNTMLNLALLHYNFLDQFPQDLEDDTPMMNGLNVRGTGGDEYGFLLDLGLDEENMGDGEALDHLGLDEHGTHDKGLG